VTPFAVVTDERTGQKYPLADYALTPSMAIVDTQLVSEGRKGGKEGAAVLAGQPVGTAGVGRSAGSQCWRPASEGKCASASAVAGKLTI
jgi:hypothetical protein